MPKQAPSRPRAGVRRAVSATLRAAGATATALAGGCGERARLTFPDPGDELGPRTFIETPAASDTSLAEGGVVLVGGRTVDPDGVDTVYAVVENGSVSFQPIVGRGDTVRFGLSVPTEGLAGRTLEVRVTGVDELGFRGDPATARVTVLPP